MPLLTGQEFASAGEIRIFSQNSVENAAVLSRTCFIKESQEVPRWLYGEARPAQRPLVLRRLGFRRQLLPRDLLRRRTPIRAILRRATPRSG